MDADKFCAAYERSGKTLRSIDEVVESWGKSPGSRTSKDFLGYQSLLLALLADQAHGDGLVDQISPDLLAAFTARRGESLNEYEEVRAHLVEMLERGDESVKGLISQIKGQVGELVFQKEVGDHAYLADLKNQEAWDVAIPHADGVTEYVQVKIYSSAERALEKMQEVTQKVADGKIFDGDTPVTHVDFAVNADIAEKLQQLAAAQPGLADVKIHTIPITEHDAASVVGESIANVGPEGMSHLFQELLGGTVAVGCLHALSNAFLAYKGAKDVSSAAGDTVISTALSAPGVVAAQLTDLALAKLALPVLSTNPVFLTVGVGLLTRAVAKSWYDSRDGLSQTMADQAGHTRLLIRAIKSHRG